MPRLKETAKGVYVITVTPFSDDGALDLACLSRKPVGGEFAV